MDRHKDELKSMYLKNIEAKRVKDEYPLTYIYFFKLVLSYFALFLKLLRLESCWPFFYNSFVKP
jgi:hypothetical protein